MIDEELGYKSIALRNSIIRFKNSDEYNKQDQGLNYNIFEKIVP